MSFQTGLSGLNASSRNLDVIGNNIANANTTGMKASRAEFGNLVASSLGAGSNSGAGIGVAVTTVSQQFSQGNINTTGNNLDVAINGGGFFEITLPDGSSAYTRDGAFKLDKDGYIKTNTGANLMGFPIDPVLGKQPFGELKLPSDAVIKAQQTTSVAVELNLDARALNATQSTAASKLPDPRSTYGTSLNVYDSQGVASPVNLYFEKTDAATNSWDIYPGIDGIPAGSTYGSLGAVKFDSSGNIDSATLTNGKFTLPLPTGTIPSANPNTPVIFPATVAYLADPITLDLTNVTQFGSNFAVSSLTQDGYGTGELTSLNIGETGVITARYSNGQTQSAGQITLADFPNVQGLSPLGGNAWSAPYETGTRIQGSPGTGKFGALRSGALEESNVDLTAELVNMMTAQRSYQANAQTIKTQDQIMSTLVNLR